MESDSHRFAAFDLGSVSRAERYKLLTGTVIPRPIAWVTTASASGLVNLAPFSQFVIVAVDPGLLGFSIGPEGGKPRKDTLANILATPEFVINIAPEGFEHLVQASSENYPADVSEADALGVKLVASTAISVPRVADALVQFECRLHKIVELGDAPNHFVVGEIVVMHAREGLISDFKTNLDLYRPLARIGGRNYVTLGEVRSA